MKLTIATPMYDGKTHHAFTSSLAEAVQEFDIAWEKLPGCADVSLARNTLLGRFRARTDSDVMVFVDADMGFRALDLQLVIDPILAGTGHVVAGLYPRKAPGIPNYTASFFPGDIDEARGYIGPVKMIGGHRYGRLALAGCGFLALSREAIEAGAAFVTKYCPWAGQSVTGSLEERHALLFFPNVHEDPRQPGVPRFWGEDSSGCETLQNLGFETMFSFEAELSHHTSEFSFGGEKPDVGLFARRLALSGDVMRAAANGKPIDEASYQRRAAAILRR